MCSNTPPHIKPWFSPEYIMVLLCSNTPPLSNRGAARANHNHHTTEQLTSATYLLQVTRYVPCAMYNFPCSMWKSEASLNWPSAIGSYFRKAATSVWHQVHQEFVWDDHSQPAMHWPLNNWPSVVVLYNHSVIHSLCTIRKLFTNVFTKWLLYTTLYEVTTQVPIDRLTLFWSAAI